MHAGRKYSHSPAPVLSRRRAGSQANPGGRHERETGHQRYRGHHPDDGAIPQDQGGARGRPAVLPHGRFLRDVLRRRGAGGRRPRHRPDQARQAPGRGYPDVRRPGPRRRGLPADPDPQGLPGRCLRADGGPGGGKKTRLQGGGQARGGAPGDAGHPDRGHPAGCPAPQLPRRLGRGPGRGRAGLGRCLDRRPHGGGDGARRAGAGTGPDRAQRGAGAGERI